LSEAAFITLWEEDTNFIMAQTDKQDLSSSLARTTSVSSSNGDAGEYETYLVQDGDSLTKIAAMHDTTPTKLAQVNRMTSKFIFPGQVLKLPAPEPPKAPTPPPPEKLTPKIEKEMVDLINNFVRINVRHITDGKGIVDGTLLLTSKLVMFDPYAHHPLVVESSVENYEIIMPYHLVVNAVILKDYLSDSDKDPSLIYYQELKNTELIQELRHDERDDKCCEGKENKTENEQTALTTNTAAITTPPKESSSKTGVFLNRPRSDNMSFFIAKMSKSNNNIFFTFPTVVENRS
jgi:LysM repeat protein